MKLFDHQAKFTRIVREKPRFLWAAEPGVGKTIGTLAVCAERSQLPSVVLAPKSILESAWANDARHFPGLVVKVLTAKMSRAERKAAIEDRSWNVLVTNYALFVKHVDDLLMRGVRRLIVDESSKVKTPDAAITKAATKFADRMESVVLLSGSPAPNSFADYAAQDRIVNGPRTPGYYAWCARYGTPDYQWIRARGGVQKRVLKGWKQSPEQHTALVAHLRGWSWALSKEECLDLPPQVDRVIDVDLTEEEFAAYSDIAQNMRLDLGNGRISRVKAGAGLMKLRQVVGGTVYVAGAAHAITDEPSKIAALNDYADEMGNDPFICWFQFRHERERIKALFKERGQHCEWIDGETSHEAGRLAQDFQAGLIPVLLCHPQAAGHGITLTRASHAIYYSLDFSFENWEQSRGRIHRAGMGDRPATYTVLRSRFPLDHLPDEKRRTVDGAMLDTVRRKGRASDGVLDALRDIGVDAKELDSE